MLVQLLIFGPIKTMKFSTTLLFALSFFTSLAQNDTLIINSNTTTSITAATSITDDTRLNNEVYKINNKIDIPLTIATTAYTLYGFSKIYSRDQTPESVILALNKENVNSFDRRVTGYRDLKAKDASDKLFYGSMPLPLIFLLDKEMRKDGFKLGLLYLQAVSSFGSLYATSAQIADRFRPYTYNPNENLGKRKGGGGRNSFFAGHPGMVATVTFFSAKIYSDYHPNMKGKWILYTVAGAAAVTTGLLRVKAGEHFYSDIMVGIPVGVATGILVPHFHRNKNRNQKLTVLPTYKSHQPGIYASLKL